MTYAVQMHNRHQCDNQQEYAQCQQESSASTICLPCTCNSTYNKSFVYELPKEILMRFLIVQHALCFELYVFACRSIDSIHFSAKEAA